MNEMQRNQHKGPKKKKSQCSVSTVLLHWFSFNCNLRNCIATSHQNTYKFTTRIWIFRDIWLSWI